MTQCFIWMEKKVETRHLDPTESPTSHEPNQLVLLIPEAAAHGVEQKELDLAGRHRGRG
jgi:hypothetical protein